MQTVKVPGLLSEFDNYVTMYPTLSVYNSFIPLNAKTNGELIQNEEDKIIYYSGWFGRGRSFRVMNYEAFCEKIISSAAYISDSDEFGIEKFHHLQRRGVEVKYYAGTGLLYFWLENNTIPIPLLVMCVKQDALFALDRRSMDPAHLCLVINKNLITEHSVLYRNVKKLYIDKVDAEGIDIVYTNNILQLCYNDRGLRLPHFSTVEEMINYTKSLNTVIHAAARRELDTE